MRPCSQGSGCCAPFLCSSFSRAAGQLPSACHSPLPLLGTHPFGSLLTTQGLGFCLWRSPDASQHRLATLRDTRGTSPKGGPCSSRSAEDTCNSLLSPVCSFPKRWAARTDERRVRMRTRDTKLSLVVTCLLVATRSCPSTTVSAVRPCPPCGPTRLACATEGPGASHALCLAPTAAPEPGCWALSLGQTHGPHPRARTSPAEASPEARASSPRPLHNQKPVRRGPLAAHGQQMRLQARDLLPTLGPGHKAAGYIGRLFAGDRSADMHNWRVKGGAGGHRFAGTNRRRALHVP